MTIVSNTFTTYDAIGNREDLINVITNISPVETTFTSKSGNGRAYARLHEWQTDALASAAYNATIEGDQVSATAVTPTTRLTNICQILRKSFSVTDTQEVVDKAGRASEVDYQVGKNLKALANDIEYALLVNSASGAGYTASARALKGYVGFVTTNLTTGASVSGLQVLTETIYNNNLALIWAQGGKPSTSLVGGFQKRTISAFTTNTRYVVADEKMLAAAVDVYQSDFGTMRIMLNHIVNDTLPHYVLNIGDWGLWVKAWLRPVKKEETARIAASRMFFIEAELTLECRQEKGHGIIKQLTTS